MYVFLSFHLCIILSFCRSFCLSIIVIPSIQHFTLAPSIRISYICLLFHPSVSLSVYIQHNIFLLFCLSVLFIYLSVLYLSVVRSVFHHCRSIYPSFYLSSIYPYIIYLSVVPSINHPYCLSACVFFWRCNCPPLPSFSTARTLLLQYECETAAQVVWERQTGAERQLEHVRGRSDKCLIHSNICTKPNSAVNSVFKAQIVDSELF